MSGIATGTLRHHMSLQEKQTTQDPVTGEMLDEWVEVARVWGSLEPLSAREFLAASAEQSEVRAKIRIRYRDGMNAKMRFVYRGLAYGVLGVLNDADSGIEHITLPVSEGVRLDQ